MFPFPVSATTIASKAFPINGFPLNLDCAEMDDELENFLRERKARVAEDKASLQHDPPYMELKTRPQRTYVTTVKENIPPKTQAEEDDSSSGLPLGLEYEKKKQKLMRELQMDYRHYIKQKAQEAMFEPEPRSLCNGRRLFKNLPDRQASLIPNLRPPSRRDAATLTEDTRGQERAPPTAQPQNRADQDQESVERWNAAAKNGINKTDSREKRVIAYGRRSKASRNEEEFATGLLIGAADTDEMIQRKKERYRKDLQEQIAEQLRNKKRERELEMKVAATGANDPEKPPDRIRQFGLQRRKEAAVETDPVPLLLHVNDKPIPDLNSELPRVAFQSPLLDYSSALGLGAGLYHSQAPVPVYHRPMDTPRISVYPPHPPSTLSDVYRSPPYEPHQFYRNPLEPRTPYYNHLAVPSGVHAPYWNIPPGGAVPSHYGIHSPHSQQSESSFPDPPSHPAADVASANSRVGQFPVENPRSAQERILSYRDALKQQIQEQQERRRVEREEKERYEAQLEEDMKRHQPWGRGGGGAPLRDSTGNLIADLNQMHKLNEEAYSHPEQRQRKAAPRRPEPDPNDRVNGTVSVCSDPDANDRINGFTHVHTPQFARGAVFSCQPTQQQLQEQDKYRAFLKLQIDEKLRLKAEERERLRLEEEREERRLSEQRARIQQEYKEEQERKRRKELEQQAKNEELIQLAEERRKEAERKRKETEERESEAQRRRQERERHQQIVQPLCREPSPPIPTLQKKLGAGAFSPRPPTVESQQSIPPPSERSLSGLQSPPVPARRNQLRAAGEQSAVFSELSALRRQLRTEQRRVEEHLQHRDWDLHSPLSDRQRDRPPVDVFDMARLRLQAPVRRPSSRRTEPRNLQKIHDSLQLKYNVAESRLGSGLVSKPETGAWRLSDVSDPYQSNSQRSTAQDDYLDLSPPHPNDYLRSVLGGSSRCSLLESESAFIEPLGEAFPVPSTPEQENKPPLSARERRRLAKAHSQDGAPSGHAEELPLQAGSRLQQEDSRSRNHRNRTGAGRYGDPTGHHCANTAGSADASDEDSPPRVAPNSVQRNARRRLATSDTLQPIRREHLVT